MDLKSRVQCYRRLVSEAQPQAEEILADDESASARNLENFDALSARVLSEDG